MRGSEKYGAAAWRSWGCLLAIYDITEVLNTLEIVITVVVITPSNNGNNNEPAGE